MFSIWCPEAATNEQINTSRESPEARYFTGFQRFYVSSDSLTMPERPEKLGVFLGVF